MGITRRSVLSTALLSGLCGCSAIRGQQNRLDWSARVADDFFSKKIYVDDDRVAVATPSGRLALLRTDSGELVTEGRSRDHLGDFAGTPPVAVGDLYLTFTDGVYAVTESGEVSWVRELPTEGHASIRSRPVVVDDRVYVTTDRGSVLRVNPLDRTVSELDIDPTPGEWWDSDGRRVVVATESYRTAVVDLTAEEVLWSRSGLPMDYPSFYDSDVISSSENDDQLVVQRVDTDAAETRWTSPVPGHKITFSGRLSSETIAVVSRYPWDRNEPSQATLIDAVSGEITDTYGLPSRIISSGDISQESLFLTSVTGGVLSIHPDDGLTRHVQSESEITSPATVHDDRVVFATGDGEVRSHTLNR